MSQTIPTTFFNEKRFGVETILRYFVQSLVNVRIMAESMKQLYVKCKSFADRQVPLLRSA